MSSFTLKPVVCRIPPVKGGNSSYSKASKVTMVNGQAPSLQMKEKEKPQSFSATSRREMMHLTAATLGLLPLLLPCSAEARARNATMRQKIMDKLEELRQKAGLSKPKDEAQETKPKDDIEDKKPKPKNGGDEKKPKDEIEDKKPKPKNDTDENKPKLKDGEEKKPATKTQQSTVPPIEEPSVPALPNIINGKTVETIFHD